MTDGKWDTEGSGGERCPECGWESVHPVLEAGVDTGRKRCRYCGHVPEGGNVAGGHTEEDTDG